MTHFSKSRILFRFSLSVAFILSLLLFCSEVNRLATCKHSKHSLLTFVLFQNNLWGGEWRENENQFIHNICFPKKCRPDYSIVMRKYSGVGCVNRTVRPVAIIITVKIKIIISFRTTKHICLHGFDVDVARQQQHHQNH